MPWAPVARARRLSCPVARRCKHLRPPFCPCLQRLPGGGAGNAPETGAFGSEFDRKRGENGSKRLEEKLREANALQRPSGVVLSKSSERFEAKSEDAAEQRRLAERQERLMLKAQGACEARRPFRP